MSQFIRKPLRRAARGVKRWLDADQPTAAPKPKADPIKAKFPKMNLHHMRRFLFHRRLLDLAAGVEGDIVECGVGHGFSLLDWAVVTFYEGPQERHLWGFDSFEGFPEPSAEDTGPRNPQAGEFAVSMEAVDQLLLLAGLPREWLDSRITLVKGYFEETLPKYTGDKIALLHVDADLYGSYKTALDLLYPKVVPGGVVAFDEYMGTWDHHRWPGAKQAVDEYFADLDVQVIADGAYNKYYVIKPGA